MGESRSWQPAVRQAMHEAAEQESHEKNMSPSPGFNYRWEHVNTVVKLALKLAGLVGADFEVVEAAAWLHDIAKQKGKDHAEYGAQEARRFLVQTDFPPNKIEQVCQAIADHQGLWREKPLTNLESMVLWDADKLSKIGLTAAIHWTGMALSQHESLTTANLIANGRKARWQEKTVSSMHTKPAQRAAEKRFLVFNQLWDELERELDGDDLD
jgi:uncharacterized protein